MYKDERNLLKTAVKTEFICVKPRSSLAQDRFDNCMDRLHSCRVIKRYTFEMFEGSDDHWEIIS